MRAVGRRHDLLDALELGPKDDTRRELLSAIHDLNDNEQNDLIALILVGRGDFGLDQWDEAKQEAANIDRKHAGKYVAEIPLASDYLEEGLSQFNETLEDYLDRPIEDLVSDLYGRAIARERIVEIGAHASEQSRATVALWARAARYLDGIADVAVAVLTAPLRGMFDRLGIEVVELCDADPARLPDAGVSWGQYYELRPKVCAGLIAPARPTLASFDDGVAGVCA